MLILSCLIFLVVRNRNLPENNPQTAETLPEEPGLEEPVGNQPPNPDEIELPFVIRPVEVVEPLFQENPENNALAAELAAAYLREGRPDDAHAIVREIVQRARLPLGIHALSDRLLEQGQYELAMVLLEEGLNRFRQDIEIQQRLMMAYILSDTSGRRVEDYLAMLHEGEHHPTTIAVGEAYMVFDNGRPQEALPILDAPEAVADGRFAADLLFLKGRLLLELDQPREALATFEEAMQHDPPPWLATRIEENIVELRP